MLGIKDIAGVGVECIPRRISNQTHVKRSSSANKTQEVSIVKVFDTNGRFTSKGHDSGRHAYVGSVGLTVVRPGSDRN